MILSVDSGGELHYENSQAHGTHGGGGTGSADGYISSIEYDATAGSAYLGHVTAIRQPGGVILRSPASTVDVHYTKAEVDALLATVNGYITLLNASVGANALYAQGLNTRLTALESSSLTFKGANGATPVSVKQIQISELPWAYYPQGEILWIEKVTPIATNPYS
jgi:hypothetical protein